MKSAAKGRSPQANRVRHGTGIPDDAGARRGPKSSVRPGTGNPNRLSPAVEREAKAAILRALSQYSAEQIGDELGIRRTAVYELRDYPDRLTLGRALQLALIDPDPDFPLRLARLFHRAAEHAAERRAKANQRTLILTDRVVV